jgi:hypothetical protein
MGKKKPSGAVKRGRRKANQRAREAAAREEALAAAGAQQELYQDISDDPAPPSVYDGEETGVDAGSAEDWGGEEDVMTELQSMGSMPYRPPDRSPWHRDWNDMLQNFLWEYWPGTKPSGPRRRGSRPTGREWVEVSERDATGGFSSSCVSPTSSHASLVMSDATWEDGASDEERGEGYGDRDKDMDMHGSPTSSASSVTEDGEYDAEWEAQEPPPSPLFSPASPPHCPPYEPMGCSGVPPMAYPYPPQPYAPQPYPQEACQQPWPIYHNGCVYYGPSPMLAPYLPPPPPAAYGYPPHAHYPLPPCTNGNINTNHPYNPSPTYSNAPNYSNAGYNNYADGYGMQYAPPSPYTGYQGCPPQQCPPNFNYASPPQPYGYEAYNYNNNAQAYGWQPNLQTHPSYNTNMGNATRWGGAYAHPQWQGTYHNYQHENYQHTSSYDHGCSYNYNYDCNFSSGYDSYATHGGTVGYGMGPYGDMSCPVNQRHGEHATPHHMEG